MASAHIVDFCASHNVTYAHRVYDPGEQGTHWGVQTAVLQLLQGIVVLVISRCFVRSNDTIKSADCTCYLTRVVGRAASWEAVCTVQQRVASLATANRMHSTFQAHDTWRTYHEITATVV